MSAKYSTLTASLVSLIGLTGVFAATPADAFTLTLLHNNDGESRLINAGPGREDFGGVARFATVIQSLRAEATTNTNGSLLISSGDNFLAGTQFNASLQKGVPFFDSIALDLIGYDAVTIGNHEFDFGPDVLADFIVGFESSVPFLSANLDFSNEPRLQALVDATTGPRIAKSAVFEVGGERVGVIGATTERLAAISSPRNVGVDANIVGAVQAEVDRLRADGVNKIIVSSHLQNIQEELNLVPQLRGVDIVIAGGGEQLLADDSTLLVPGDEGNIFGPYPLIETRDADGRIVPVVTTPGDYTYVGRLIVEFDDAGDIVRIGDESGLVRIAGGDLPDAVAPDPVVQSRVVEPVEAAIAELAANVIGFSEVPLDGARENIRTRETNLGNLVADSLLWQAAELADDFGIQTPQVALQNGGGIRASIPQGDVSELATFDTLAFANFVSIVPNVAADKFKELLEWTVSGDLTPEGELSAEGRFAQVAGFQMGIEIESAPGSRVKQVVLNDGTVIVRDGMVVANAPAISVATIDFLARGGDAYPFDDAPFTSVGVTYQQAFVNYIQQVLSGQVTAADYGVDLNERIFQGEVPGFPLPTDSETPPPASVPEPASAIGLLLLGAWGASSRLKRKQTVVK